MDVLRYIKIGILACIALFFSLIAFDNLIDFESNWEFVQHVLSMDTTFQHPAVMWRAITNPTIQLIAYYLIIIWQILTAALCWIGCINLLTNINSNQFDSAKRTAFIGLFLGFLLYMVGFLIIGGEWFSMWQSQKSNGQATAGLFLNFILFTFLILQHRDENKAN